MVELTVVADMVWRVAAVEARRAGASALGVDHLLVGLLSLEKLLDPSAGLEPARRELVRVDHEIIVQLLARLNQDVTSLRRVLRRQMQHGAVASTAVIHRDEACRAVFARAGALARELGNEPCGALHLLAAVLETPPPGLVEALPSYTGNSAINRLRVSVMARITHTLQPATRPPEPLEPPVVRPPEYPPVQPDPMTPMWPNLGSDGLPRTPLPGPGPTTPQAMMQSFPQAAPPVTVRPSSDDPPIEPASSQSQPQPSPQTAGVPVPAVLLRFGRDLTAEAEAGTLGPVIGRRDEMLQVVRALRLRTKNSPVLIGEAGVGKTAVVEGLACRIAEGTVLPGRRIVALSLPSVLAGTTYRGQFEERLEEILTELRARPGHHPLPGRAAHHRGGRRPGRPAGRRQHPEASIGAGGDRLYRRDDHRRVPAPHRHRSGPGAAVPAGHRG